MKRAVLVSPSYALGLDARLTRILEESTLLPKDLGEYSTSGFAADAGRFKKLLGEGFSHDTLTGDVLKKNLLAAVRQLMAPDTEVAVLLFCGHGTWSGSPQHGALLCSFGPQLTAEEIDNIAVQQRFTGTFVRVLNTCEAEGYPCSNENPPLTFSASRAQAKGDWQNSQQSYNPSCEAYAGITICASSTFGKAHCSAAGSKFIEALTTAVVGDKPITYHGLAAVLKQHYPNAIVIMTGTMNSMDGNFGDCAKQVCENNRSSKQEPAEICFGCGRCQCNCC